MLVPKRDEVLQALQCCSQELTAKWQEVRELVPKRDEILQAEMVRQQNNERLREQFAAKANAVGQWLESRLDKVLMCLCI